MVINETNIVRLQCDVSQLKNVFVVVVLVTETEVFEGLRGGPGLIGLLDRKSVAIVRV